MITQHSAVQNSENNRKRNGFIISAGFHILVVLLMILPWMIAPEIEESSGILIAFGDPELGIDASQSESMEQTSSPSPSSASTPIASSEAIDVASKVRTEEAVVVAKEKEKPMVKPKEAIKKDVLHEATLKEKQAAEAKSKADALKKAKVAEDKAKADREAAEKAAAANQKKKFSDLLKNGSGNQQKSGNSGQNNGDPNGKALEGITKGSGKVGGGLSGRGIEFEPTFNDNSQKTGRVSLSVCVDSKGKVSKAEFTQKGSTTSDAYLIDLARKNALKYRFSKSDIDSQCGTVTIDFRVQ